MFQEVYNENQFQKIQNEFERLGDKCYLDNTGTTLYAKSQIESVTSDLLSNVYGNTHSSSLTGKYCTDSIDQIRYSILQFFNTTSDEYSVIFTTGATGAIKILAESFDWSFKKTEKRNLKGTFCYLQDNHTSVLGAREIAANNAASIQVLTHDDAFELLSEYSSQKQKERKTNSLFVYSGQCNFSGFKYPLEWIDKIKNGALNKINCSNWFCLLDAATFVSTNPLDLTQYKPDFVCISFYKIFGYPTGLGALLVKNSSAHVLKRNYYGGGTVLISLSTENFHILRPNLSERFEDGTLPFLSIISLRHGFELFQRLHLTMDLISQHTLILAQYFYNNLLILHHENGKPLAKIYSDTDYTEKAFQGNIVNFNLLRPNGDYVGFIEVLNMANLYGIQLRTGCFCNPGACQRHLKLTIEDLKHHFQAGHVCGDDHDLVNGQPTGSIRVSFGYMSTRDHADYLLNMIKLCFLDGEVIFKIPEEHDAFQKEMHQKLKIKSHIKSLTLKDINITKYQNNFKGLDIKSKKFENNSVKIKNILLQITIFPIKSCSGFRPYKWPINHKGLLYDREWMIITESGVCLTQKQEPRMCLLSPLINIKKNSMELSFPGMEPIQISLEVSSNNCCTTKLCQSKVCNDRVEGFDCGDEVADWLSRAFKRSNLRLIRQSNTEKRYSFVRNGKIEATQKSISLVNQGQFLLINDPTITWLQKQVENFEKHDLSDRFRSNLIISSGEAFDENNWSEIKIGQVLFKVDGPCTRCQMVCIDQKSGERSKEPLSTLARLFQGKMKLGLYLSHSYEKVVSIKIGDVVKILKSDLQV